MWPNRGASFNLCAVAACRVCRVCVVCVSGVDYMPCCARIWTWQSLLAAERGEEDRGLTKLTDNNAVHAESRI